MAFKLQLAAPECLAPEVKDLATLREHIFSLAIDLRIKPLARGGRQMPPALHTDRLLQ